MLHGSLHLKNKRQNFDGQVTCFTCDAVLVIGTSNCQAGHWLSQRVSQAHVFESDNVRPQCFHCNISLRGNSEVFRRRLQEEIGEDRIEELYRTRSDKIKRTAEWYLSETERYKGLNGKD